MTEDFFARLLIDIKTRDTRNVKPEIQIFFIQVGIKCCNKF
jgi:hypothetical protein